MEIQPSIPLRRSLACVATSMLLWLTQGLGMNLVAVNLPQLQGVFGASLNEVTWLMAAYMAPNVSLTLILMKVRTQFGLRAFTELSLVVFLLASLLHLFVRDLHAAVAVRFIAGMAAAPMSTLGFLYMLEAFPAAKKMSWGISMALTCSVVGAPLARILSPALFDLGQWHGMYLLELGLTAMSLCAVYLLPLAPVPHAKVLHRLDFVSYPLLATGFGLLAVVLVLGRGYWWLEAPWIGICLAVAVVAIAAAAAIELNRGQPLVDLHWLASPGMLHFTAVLLLFRIVLSEQTAGAMGLFQALGLLNEQARGLQVVILLASVAGGFACGMLLGPGRTVPLHAAALALICAGAWMDAHASHLTRPAGMLLSQAMIAFGGALFLPPAVRMGLEKTLARGTTHLTSFIVVFLFTQSIGGLMGSALFGSLVTLRGKFHSSQLAGHVVATDPQVQERFQQLSSAYAPVLADPALRRAEGVVALSRQAATEAAVLAYNDIFLLISALAAAALAALLAHALYDRLALRAQGAREPQAANA